MSRKRKTNAAKGSFGRALLSRVLGNRRLTRYAWMAGGAALLLWTAAWLAASPLPGRALDAALGGFYTASADAGFAVRHVLVEGRVHADPDLLHALLNVDAGEPLLRFDPYAAREALSRISWVRAARVERRWPDTIYVRLEERAPFALWKEPGGTLRLIDREGVVLTDDGLSRFRDLPVVAGGGARLAAADFLPLVAAEPEIAGRVLMARRIEDRRWDLHLRNGVRVLLPETDAALALRRLVSAHDSRALLDKNIEEIDVRAPDRIIILTQPGAARAIRASMQRI